MRTVVPETMDGGIRTKALSRDFEERFEEGKGGMDNKME